MLMYQKIMFDSYYCIKTVKHFVTWKFRRKCFEKFFFPLPIMAQKVMLPTNVLQMPLPGQMIASFWRYKSTFATVHVTDDDIKFCEGHGMIIRKTAKPCINSTWIALLIHGFVQVKTWLLIACNTAFYPIIANKIHKSLLISTCNLMRQAVTQILKFIGLWQCLVH